MSQGRTLTILAGCPTGATWDALRLQGVGQGELQRLVDRGLIVRRVRQLAVPRGLTVISYEITHDGRRYQAEHHNPVKEIK